MMPTRGQVESSFQWVFVLVAGTSLLLLLFFFVRSCTDQGEQSVAGISLLATSQRIERVSWQPEGESELILAPSQVSCTGGRVTFTSESGSATLERSAAFLPPEIGGDMHAVIRKLTLSQTGSPGIELGSALFGIDAATQYLILSDASGGYPELTTLIPEENRRIIGADALLDPAAVAKDLPRATRTLIIVTNKNEGYVQRIDLSDVPEGVRVRGVYIGSLSAVFYTRDGARLTRVRDLPIEHPLLGLGAAVSGDAALYTCGHEALSQRAVMLTHLYAQRAGQLASVNFGTCGQLYTDGAATLNATADIGSILAQQQHLISIQQGLLNAACPVLA